MTKSARGAPAAPPRQPEVRESYSAVKFKQELNEVPFTGLPFKKSEPKSSKDVSTKLLSTMFEDIKSACSFYEKNRDRFD
jgi:hypothetical protein